MGGRSELLARGLAGLGLDADAVTLGRFESYLAELELWNSRIDLVNASGDQLIVRHVLDSLAGLAVVGGLLAETCPPPGPGGTGGPRLADIGSGAGFPGIPLALFLPQAAVSLVEPSAKRAAFLRTVVALLGLHNAQVSEKRLEELDDCYDIVTFRAFKPLEADLLAKLGRVMTARGAIVAYKGRRETVERELAGLGEALARSGLRAESVELNVPFLDEERHALVIRRPLSI